MAIVLIVIINLANLASVVPWCGFVIRGGKASGHSLVISLINIWWTNIFVFTLGSGSSTGAARQPALATHVDPRRMVLGLRRLAWQPGLAGPFRS